MNISQSSIKVFAADLISAVITFVGIAIFARKIGAAAIGVFFLFQSLLGILSVPGDFGIREAVEKRISEQTDSGKILTTAIILKVIPLLIISSGIFIFADVINEYIGAKIAIVLVVALFVHEFGLFVIKILNGELRVGETAVLRLSRQVTWVGVGLFLVYLDYKSLALIYGLIAGSAITLLWGAKRCSTPLHRPSIACVHSLLNYSKYSVISSIGGYFYSWMDVAIIGLFLTQAHVGAYEIAWRVSAVVLLFSNSIATAIFPQVSEWNTTGSKKRIENMISRTLVPSFALVIPAFLGTSVISKKLLGILFGSEYSVAWLVLIILMGEKVLQSVHVILGRSLQAIDQPDLAARATIVSVVLNLILNVLFIWKFGIVGAAIATTISFTVNTYLHALYLSRFVSIRFPYRQIGWCIVASLGMTGMVLAIQSWIVINSSFRLILVISVATVIYSGLVFIYRPLRIEIMDDIKKCVHG